VFGSGYLANAGIIPALIGPRDLLLIDELSHACLWAGAQLSRATVMTFRHADVAHAAELMAAHRDRHQRALLATDGVFSMDGDLAPLPELAALAERFDAWLMTDDAHGLGVIGGGRAGVCARSQVNIPLQMGTLSGDRRLWRLSLRLRRGDRPHPQSRAPSSIRPGCSCRRLQQARPG
jgi:8-amino-7-oxononanoate synthase